MTGATDDGTAAAAALTVAALKVMGSAGAGGSSEGEAVAQAGRSPA